MECERDEGALFLRSAPKSPDAFCEPRFTGFAERIEEAGEDTWAERDGSFGSGDEGSAGRRRGKVEFGDEGVDESIYSRGVARGREVMDMRGEEVWVWGQR